MTDTQIVNLLGIDDTLQMLTLREQMKAALSPEDYAENMRIHKASIKNLMATFKGMQPVEASNIIVTLMEQDETMHEDQREIWKAVNVIAAFEMQEMNL